MRALSAIGLTAALLGSVLTTQVAQAQEVLVVNLTADWCSSCKVFDPRLEEATSRIQDSSIERIELDFTNETAIGEAYEKVNGTLAAGVFADYAGLTGMAVLVAADSGEQIECLNKSMTVDVIEHQIKSASRLVRETGIGHRDTGSMMCPAPNKRVLKKG